MKTLRLFFSALFVLGLAEGYNAQNATVQNTSYRTAIGVRGGYTSGLTVKQMLGSTRALEGIFAIWDNGFGATLLLENHSQAFQLPGLNWYYGAGGHVSLHNDSYFRYYHNNRVYHADGSVSLGVDGIVGLEYKIPPIPFAVSIDLKPMLEVNNAGGVGMALDSGIGVKFTF